MVRAVLNPIKIVLHLSCLMNWLEKMMEIILFSVDDVNTIGEEASPKEVE